MSVNLPITKERIRNHWQYGAWKYQLLVALSLLGVNLICTMTAYKPPESLKVEFYVEGYSTTEQEKLDNEWMESVRQEVLPDMEQVTLSFLSLDDTYGDTVLFARLAAGEGDVYLLSKDRFQQIGSTGAMMDLQPLLDEGLLHADGIDLTNGYAADEDTGEMVLCAIPADTLIGLNQYGIYTDGMVLCVLRANGNDENVVKFADYLLTKMR